MAKLRFGFFHLPANEIALVKAFFRLYGTHPEFPWEIAETGRLDAVLTGEEVTEIPEESCDAATQILRISDDRSACDHGNCLARPLRSDKLESWLLNAANGSGSSAASQASRQAPAPRPEKRMRLLRWPPSLLLRRDPLRIRLATMMTKRPLSMAEIGEITAWPNEQCENFIDALRAVGLIQESPLTANPVASTPAIPSAPKGNEGFFSRFRRKLGL